MIKSYIKKVFIYLKLKYYKLRNLIIIIYKL